MRCTKCGEEVGLLHECSGPSTAVQAMLLEPAPLLRFAPFYYLSQAVAIARFDERAILRNSRDNNAFLYGVPLWLVANTPLAFGIAGQAGFAFPFSLIFAVVALPVALGLQVAVWTICHLAAKFILHGKGRLAAINRVMLLGSIVGLVGIIPLIGPIVSGLWGLAIMMVTFEAIHGIRRIHAFAISLVIGIALRAIGLIG